MTEISFTAVLLTSFWCTNGLITDGKCDDGSIPHKLEMRVLDGVTNQSGDLAHADFSKADIKSLFVVKKDEVEIVNVQIPGSLSKDDIGRLLKGLHQ